MNLSIIILTRNAEEKLEDCLRSVEGMGEIIVLDGRSTDRTVEIAKKAGAKVVKQRQGGYSVWRNQGKKIARGEWLLYVDFDERVTPELKSKIEEIINHKQSLINAKSLIINHYIAYAIPRRNFVFGKELKHGGWYPDYVLRLMQARKLIKWEGELHEQPRISGETGHLKEALIHLKEDNLEDMVKKTNKWSEIEAKLLLDSGHPKMAWWRFIRPVVSEIFDRLILKLGFLDGPKGIIFSIYQGYSVFMRYAKLWEMQQRNG